MTRVEIFQQVVKEDQFKHLGYCRKQGVPLQDAEDLQQEAYLSVYCVLRLLDALLDSTKLTTKAEITAYTWTALVNRYRSWCKKQERQQGRKIVEAGDEIVDTIQTDPLGRLILLENLEMLMRLIAQLSSEEQEFLIVYLRVYCENEGRPNVSETGRRLGLTTAQAHERWRRIKEALQLDP